MKSAIADLLQQALHTLHRQGILAEDITYTPHIERARNPAHGDFASNIALVQAKAAQLPPRALAKHLLAVLPRPDWLVATEIAGPGFINFRLAPFSQAAVVAEILSQGANFGCTDQLGQNQRVHIEYVSANPTGPLHIGHGRGAVYGSAVANLLAAVGYQVHREYYVNDAGRQMDILAVSVWLRYLECLGETLIFPANGYQGHYVHALAADLQHAQAARYHHPADQVFRDLGTDSDPEQYMDTLIQRTKQLLGTAGYQAIFRLGRDRILAEIQADLADLRVTYDQWYAEQSLFDRDHIARAIAVLEKAGYLYTATGGRWFRATDLGDGKDRVIVRENGQPTYFASDITYHLDKLSRGFQRLINVWGADHHGYIPRVRAALQAAGQDADCLDVLLVQFASLYENGVKQSMSTRSGEFVTLRTLYADVGVDATRFFYLMRRSDQHLAFDLDLARAQSTDNPVYYVQYAHARICAVLRQAQTQAIAMTTGITHLTELTDPHETALLKLLGRYPEVVQSAAQALEPHQLTQYLRQLAQALHAYYNACQFLLPETEAARRDARLKLITAIGQVLRNGLSLLGVQAPEKM